MRAPPPHRFRDARRPVQTADLHRAPSLAPSRIEAVFVLRRLPARVLFPRHGSCGSQARCRRAASQHLSPPSCSERDLGSYRPQRGPLPSRSSRGGTTPFGCRSSISSSAGFGNLTNAHVAVYVSKVAAPTTLAVRTDSCATRGLPLRTSKEDQTVPTGAGGGPRDRAQRTVSLTLVMKPVFQDLDLNR